MKECGTEEVTENAYIVTMNWVRDLLLDESHTSQERIEQINNVARALGDFLTDLRKREADEGTMVYEQLKSCNAHHDQAIAMVMSHLAWMAVTVPSAIQQQANASTAALQRYLSGD
jgi:hypothetical protein